MTELAHRVTADSARSGGDSAASIVLIAGRVRFDDRVGHHDYIAGCRLLAGLLSQRSGVAPIVVENGWPEDASILEGAASIVIYDGGGGKQGFLRDDSRIAILDRAVSRGCGLVLIHQCVGFPRHRVGLGRSWLGGVYVPGMSRRGHWQAVHERFPEHPVTRGVGPWSLKDGWLTALVFVEGMVGVTPLVWASTRQSSMNENSDIAAWVYQRPDGGRSFAYTGVDSHAAWSCEGLRRLVTNAVLWSANLPIDPGGADVTIDASALAKLLTPRASLRQRAASLARKALSRVLGSERRW